MALDTDKFVRLRLQQGWSQSETARQAGITPSYVSQLERQFKTNPSPDVLKRLADALGVDVMELVA